MVIGTNIKTGEVINFKSIRQAEKETGVKHTNISQVILGRRAQAGGYYWKREGAENRGRQRGFNQKIPPFKFGYVRGGDYVTFFDEDRGNWTKKQAIFRPDTQILTVMYQFYVDCVDGRLPNLDAMQRRAKRRIEMVYGRSIVVYDGNISRTQKGQFYVYAELTTKTGKNTDPTEGELRSIARTLSEVIY